MFFAAIRTHTYFLSLPLSLSLYLTTVSIAVAGKSACSSHACFLLHGMAGAFDLLLPWEVAYLGRSHTSETQAKNLGANDSLRSMAAACAGCDEQSVLDKTIFHPLLFTLVSGNILADFF